jgi:hypothetical protein
VNEDIQKAARDAIEAADNTDQLKLIVAVLQAQQLLNAQQQPQCQHQAPKSSLNVGKWAAVAVAGSVAAISLALSAIAVAVGAIAVTCCLIVLRGLWSDFQKGR